MENDSTEETAYSIACRVRQRGTVTIDEMIRANNHQLMNLTTMIDNNDYSTDYIGSDNHLFARK